eukprot:scpid34813/ scgid3675/ Lateral signaling target protein 2 homolog; Zinc finger FYVE domain-containing protein 28
MSRFVARSTNGVPSSSSSTTATNASEVAQLNASITSPPGCRFSFFKQLWRKPKKTDNHLLANFYREDSKLQQTVMRLLVIPTDQQTGEEAKTLSQRMRRLQGVVMNLIMDVVREALPDTYNRRDFRAKYTEEVVTDNINGALWHAAECLSFGVEIAYHPSESLELQPLAAQMSSLIDSLRTTLRTHCHIKELSQLPANVRDLLQLFDVKWAEFEWNYASMMCPVLTLEQYDQQQETVVLMCEAAQRALRKGWLNAEMFEFTDPVLMFAIPRLAIVTGLSHNTAGPLDLSRGVDEVPQCFRVFLKVLVKVKNLLEILKPEELDRLESALCSSEGLCTSDRSQTGQLKAVTVVVKRRPRSKRLDAVSQEDEAADDSKRTLSQSKSVPGAGCMYTKSGRRLEKWEEPSAQELRAAFPNTDDLLQRLFVAISGIADQMHNNFAGQLRTILQRVFVVCTPDEDEEVEMPTEHPSSQEKPDDEEEDNECLAPLQEANNASPARAVMQSPLHVSRVQSPVSTEHRVSRRESVSSADSPRHAVAGSHRPVWVPDDNTVACMGCEQPFTLVRRKHHCRSCGHVFCSRCSGHAIPLPHLQYNRPVRVCDSCVSGLAATSHLECS